MARVFVSYSTEDRSWIEKIEKFLSLSGHDPIIDYSDLRAGHDLTGAIQAQIASADFFCLVLSQDSMASPWVLTKELPYALHQKLRIIPILLENCNIPPRFRESDTLILQRAGILALSSWQGRFPEATMTRSNT
jgi:hypothetical protein